MSRCQGSRRKTRSMWRLRRPLKVRTKPLKNLRRRCSAASRRKWIGGQRSCGTCRPRNLLKSNAPSNRSTMRNPFEGLLRALEVIAQEAKVLPATGQAMEDLMRPDHAEVIDTLRTGDDNVMDVLLETPNRSPYVELVPIHRSERHPLRYFLDGSARTFFLGDAVEGNRRTPIHVAQVGAVAVVRGDDGRVNVAKAVHRIVLMIDKKAVSFGDRV